MTVLLWTGRTLFALIFIMGGMDHFYQLEGYAQHAGSKGVPAPKLAVAGAGLFIVLGGVSVLFWTWVDVGAWLLAGFLLVAAFTIHDFWALEDEQERQNQMGHFLKNLSMAGAAIVFYVLYMRPDILA